MREAVKPSRQVRRAKARQKQPTRRAFRFSRLAAPLLVAAGLFAYHNALNGPFVLDDVPAIPDNATIRTLWPASGVLSPPAQSAVTGRPLVNLSLALNYAASGLNVVPYHAFNIAIHLLAAVVLFGIIRRTLGGRGPEDRDHDPATGIATAAALLWVVHPLVTESVDYTIQRTELVMGLFFLLTLFCAIRVFDSPGSPGWQAAAVASFALGMGSKEVIVVAPLVVLVYDRLFRSRSFRDALQRHWRLYAGFAGVLVLFVLLVATRFRRVFTGMAGRSVTPWDYALTQSGVIVHYLRLSLWPHPLAADYDGWPIATSPVSVLPYLVVVLALVALTLWGLARRRKLAFLGVWFFFILAPTSSFRQIPSEVAGERRMYLPLVAVVALLVLAGRALFSRLDAPRIVSVTVTAALAITLSLVTVHRNDDYRTVLSFWSDAVAKRPDNPRARMSLGDYYFRHGRGAEAVAQLAEAVRLQPGSAKAQFDLGIVLANQGRMDEAIEHYRETLRIFPENASAHNNLAAALAGRFDIDGAIEQYREAIRIEPGHAVAHYNLALALGQRGRMEEEIQHLEAAVRLQPDFAQARRTLDDLRGRASR
ncbi:MAG TPA: tetratricopeptide repeat protein [Thermoanaerobaculia bacterium]